MEFLAPFITSFTTAIAMLAAVWIWRKTKRIQSVEFALAIGTVIYTVYHYFACGIGGVYLDPLHEIITGLFIGAVAIINAYCSPCRIPNVEIGVDRRKDKSRIIEFEDRRKGDSHVLFKNVAGHKS